MVACASNATMLAFGMKTTSVLARRPSPAKDRVGGRVDGRKVERLAQLFKVLGDETRMRIIALLVREELCVCHIEEALECPQSTISRHLGVLRAAGVVDTRREGSWVYYSMSQEQPPEVAAHLRSLAEQFAGPALRGRRGCG